MRDPGGFPRTRGNALTVMPGTRPGIPIGRALRFSHRDGRDRPGHDVVESESVIPGERSEGRGSI